MVAQMTSEPVEWLCSSPIDDSLQRLTGCHVAIRSGGYDYERQSQKENKRKENRMPVWDFVIALPDGTACRLHPQLSATKIEVLKSPDGHEEPVPIAKAGLGNRYGPGTYRFYQTVGCFEESVLRFDGMKRPSWDKTGKKGAIGRRICCNYDTPQLRYDHAVPV